MSNIFFTNFLPSLGVLFFVNYPMQEVSSEFPFTKSLIKQIFLQLSSSFFLFLNSLSYSMQSLLKTKRGVTAKLLVFIIFYNHRKESLERNPEKLNRLRKFWYLLLRNFWSLLPKFNFLQADWALGCVSTQI